MKQYEFTREGFEASYADLEPLYRAHYGEMQSRLAADGIAIGNFNPRLDQYASASREGWLLTWVVRLDGVAVGYSNVWLTQDMHNSELIAQEDTIYITPAHRNGVGRLLVKAILADLRERGVKRGYVSPVTDLRVGPIWQRMGFRPVAQTMVFEF